MKKISLLLCLTLTFTLFNFIFAWGNGEYKLTIPRDAKLIEITEENFHEYFEDVKVIDEYEKDGGNLGEIRLFYNDNVLIDLEDEWKYDGFFNINYDSVTTYGEYNEVNDLWLLSRRHFTQFTVFYKGYFAQANGIYDASGKVLYSLAKDDRSRGYVLSYVNGNGNVEMAKFEVAGYGMTPTYKITLMTARFKKLPYITVAYNGEFIEFDQKPVIDNGRTLVPLRAIFEKIGAQVEWDGDTQTVTAKKDGTEISLTIDNTVAKKNGEEIALDVPAKIINGRTLVPVRFVADCFGVEVGWDGELKKVSLTK